MKYVFWGFIGLVVLGVVVVGGGAYWLANMKVDFKDPQMVGKFTETFTKNCVASYQQKLSKSGVSPTEAQLTNVESACNCARDPIVAALAKRPVMTVSELATSMATDPEILAATKSCSEKFGIANPS